MLRTPDILKRPSCIEAHSDTGSIGCSPELRTANSRYRIERADPLRHGEPVSMLINRMYSWRGLTPTSTNLTQASPHQITLVTSSADEVFGTVTLSLDSDQRLLADQLYPQELNFFRRRGHSICEITRLAVDTPHRSKEVLGALFHLAYIHARLIHKVTDVLVEVNPRHVPFYCRMLGFTPYPCAQLILLEKCA